MAEDERYQRYRDERTWRLACEEYGIRNRPVAPVRELAVIVAQLGAAVGLLWLIVALVIR